MTVKREFTTAQALQLINASEGNIVRDGRMRKADHDEPGAHSLGRHLVSAGNIKGVPSGPQAGADFVKNRFINSPDMVSSAWYKKGDMAIRLAEALNSKIGQKALEAIDNQGLTRIVIHYINQNTMSHPTGLFDPSHMSVDYTVTPDSFKTEDVDIYNKKVSPPIFIKTIQKKKKIKGFTTPNVSDKDVVGIHLVLDVYPGDKLHLQTLFPSFELAANSFEYSVWDVSWTVTETGSGFKKVFKAN